jgi:hypothetical protein
MQDDEAVFSDSVENFKWVADQRNHADLRWLRQPLTALCHYCYSSDRSANMRFHSRRYRKSKTSATVFADFDEIGYGTRCILDLHLRRNSANADSTSSLVASSPRAT